MATVRLSHRTLRCRPADHRKSSSKRGHLAAEPPLSSVSFSKMNVRRRTPFLLMPCDPRLALSRHHSPGKFLSADEPPQHLAELAGGGDSRNVGPPNELVKLGARDLTGERVRILSRRCPVGGAPKHQGRHADPRQKRHEVLLRVGVEEAPPGVLGQKEAGT